MRRVTTLTLGAISISPSHVRCTPTGAVVSVSDVSCAGGVRFDQVAHNGRP